METVSGYAFWDRPAWGDVVFLDNVFNNDEIEEIVKIGTSLHPKKAINSTFASKEFRDSLASFIFPDDSNEWIFKKLSQLIIECNEKYFQYQIYGLFEGLQFAEYSESGHHIDWHVDRAPSLQNRKLSISIQLSDPSSYSGGEFEILNSNFPTETPNEKGSAILFSSFILHRVKPIIRGTRHSLVAWVTGPPFK